MITRLQKIVAGSAILLAATFIACCAGVAFDRANPPADPIRSETGP